MSKIEVNNLIIEFPFSDKLKTKLKSFVFTSKILGYQVYTKENPYSENKIVNFLIISKPFKQIKLQNDIKSITINIHYTKNYEFEKLDMWETYMDNEMDMHCWKLESESEIDISINKILEVL